MICPKTLQGCCDDLCRGSGCLEMDGYPMLRRCDACGCLIDEEMGDGCQCDDEEFWGGVMGEPK